MASPPPPKIHKIVRKSTRAPVKRKPTSTTATSTQMHKKSKVGKLVIVDQHVVTVSVEPAVEASSVFKIHKYLLCDHSPQFKEFWESTDEDKVLILYDVSVETFETFSKWLYTKQLAIKGWSSRNEFVKYRWSNKDRAPFSDAELGIAGGASGTEGDGDSTISTEVLEQRDELSSDGGGEEAEDRNRNSWYGRFGRNSQVGARLVDLYIFADKHQIPLLRYDAILAFQRFFVITYDIPCPSVVRHALNHLDITSPLCKLLIRWYGDYTDYRSFAQKGFATLTADFLAAVLELTFKRLDDDEDTMSGEDWCDYHEHEDPSAREACRAGRGDDRDVINEKLRLRRISG